MQMRKGLICLALVLALPGTAGGKRAQQELIAYVSRDFPGYSIRASCPDESGARTIYTGSESIHALVWSPDGERLAYIEGDAGNLYTIKEDGSERTLLAHGLEADASRYGGIVWSPDGRFLAGALERTGPPRAVIVSSRGGLPQILPADGVPAWSPNSERVAVAILPRSRRGPSAGIFTMTPAGENVRRITRSRGAFDSSPRWLPDGKSILFVSTRGSRHVRNLFKARVGSRRLQRLTRATAIHQSIATYAVSPDGSLVAWAAPAALQGRLLVASTGAVRQRGRLLAAFPAADQLSWSPDGRQIAYTYLLGHFRGSFVVAVNLADRRGTAIDTRTNWQRTPAWRPA